MGEIKVLGFWSSPFVHRVIWALKLKGISYEYIEIDRHNKGELLLQSNPVYKKVPVLIHGGRAIPESMVILEYIEDTWPHNPLLPKDNHQKALARFWIKFGEDSIASITDLFLRPHKDEQERASAWKRAQETISVIEEQGLGEKKFFGGNNIGMVDIAYGCLSHWLEGLEEIVGMKLIEPNKFPRLHAWTQNFKQVPVIKENLPDYGKLLIHLQWRRQQ
ncbi:probable glutathione S-transferase [Vigna radiata var. radiata]|uniref:glutathione transferase n=1 Tax=Vigna radiata var. radiata TaxID=3916 RepID=A0A1S3V280_VIGRR|nr:probable glutathione S-transferase [Vigna radiata var. radiata]